ncbi:MAG: 4Fe-4S binding protein [Candidatus Accumulibacter sp.]|nr:4Fe-4S binding protein [Accumulibacter sp.]
MDKPRFEALLGAYVESAPGNRLRAEIALRPDLAGMRFFEAPLAGYAAPDDGYFSLLGRPEAIGGHFIPPREWLPGAKTVISVFLPFTAQIKRSNRKDMIRPSDEWLHARIEGQVFQNELSRYLADVLEDAGFAALAPPLDPRFRTGTAAITDKTRQDFYTSNWSERHVAYVCGLGTFGVSKGLITAKGVAGRFISLVTAAEFAPTGRAYSDVYEYCTRCGLCVRNCPVKAISLDTGKSHSLRSEFLDETREKHRPRYGCGKCQVRVSCSHKIPGRKNSP